jgi:hypothetical protein
MCEVVRDGHDTLFAEVGGDEVAGNAVVDQGPVVVHAGTDDAELDRVEQAPAVEHVLEAVPGLAGMQHPAVGVVRQERRRRIGEGHLVAGRRIEDLRRVPG